MHPLQAANMTMETQVPLEEILYNCYESEGFVKFQYTVDDLLLAASTASTIFNVLVIFCAFKLFKRSGDTMHLFIINMTLGDLLLTVFCHPNEFLMRKHSFLRHIHLCALIHFCNWLGLAVSGLSLTLLNVDKLIYFRWPLRYDQTMSKRRAAILCFFIWSVSFGFVSYVWIFEIVYATADCMLQMTDEKKYFYEIFMIMFCVLPVTSSLVVSTYLFRLTRQKQSAPVSLDGAQVDIRTFKNKVRSLVFIFATTAWTSFSLLPYRIFNICRIHLFEWNSIACEQRDLMNWLAWMLIYLLTLNPIVNPLITAIIYAPYRMTIKKLLINIPIGNRLQYTYRGETTETSYLSVRKTRARSEHEMIHTDANANAGSAAHLNMTSTNILNNAAGSPIPILSLNSSGTTSNSSAVIRNKNPKTGHTENLDNTTSYANEQKFPTDSSFGSYSTASKEEGAASTSISSKHSAIKMYIDDSASEGVTSPPPTNRPQKNISWSIEKFSTSPIASSKNKVGDRNSYNKKVDKNTTFY